MRGRLLDVREIVEALGLILILAGCITLAVVAGIVHPLFGWAVAALEVVAVGVVLVVTANRPGGVVP